MGVDEGGSGEGGCYPILPFSFGSAASPTRALPLLASVTRFVVRVIILQVKIVLFVIISVYRGRFLRFRSLGLGWSGNVLWTDGSARVEQATRTEPFTVGNGVQRWDQTP